MKNKFITHITTYAVIFLLVICVMAAITEDKEPPKITFQEDSILYYEGEDTYMLLSDVKAKDKVEGDVTHTLTIESIQPFADGNRANVIYAARDSKNNIGKVNRVVGYVPKNAIEYPVVDTDPSMNIPSEDYPRNV